MKQIDRIFYILLISLFLSVIWTKDLYSQNSKSMNNDSIRLDGYYSLINSSQDEKLYEPNSKYYVRSPIIFLPDGKFIQEPYCSGINRSLISTIVEVDLRLDYGNYYISGTGIVMDGVFTFFDRGMDRRWHQKTFCGYTSQSGDTLFLKLKEPYDPIKLKFNKSLAKHIENNSYYIYVFKPLDLEELSKIDANFYKRMRSKKSACKLEPIKSN